MLPDNYYCPESRVIPCTKHCFLQHCQNSVNRNNRAALSYLYFVLLLRQVRYKLYILIKIHTYMYIYIYTTHMRFQINMTNNSNICIFNVKVLHFKFTWIFHYRF